MIKSTKKVIYGDTRTGLKEAFVKLEISSSYLNPELSFYQIQHMIITDEDAVISFCTSQKNIDRDQYNYLSKAVEDYIKENQINTSELSPIDVDYLKLKIGLLLVVKSDFLPSGKTVWELEPEDWELC